MTEHADCLASSEVQAAPIVQALQQVTDAIAQLFGPYVSGKIAAECMTRSMVKQAWDHMHRTEPEAEDLRQLSYTRLALATGMDTRKVRKLLSEPLRASKEHICVEAAILNAWAKDPSLRNRYNKQPADLPIYGKAGTFEGLVARYAGRGVSVRYVQERLEKHGNVKTVSKHFIRLLSSDWVLFENNEDSFLKEVICSLVNHAATIRHNLECIKRPEKKWAERYSLSYFIPENKRDELERVLNAHQIQAWEQAREIIKSYEGTVEGDLPPGPPIGVGYYFWDGQGDFAREQVPTEQVHKLSQPGPYSRNT